ncbi:WbqC family protein [Sulfurovum sp. CS9]|uniref:WbqC family protein n=1 Tax=Sulfurovum sp. CS9 TaxID=3391146 RepID=UPI0039ECF16F
MKLGMMQPYFLSYIGYFQLIQLVDVYVVADDLNFIKNSYIKKNSILDNGAPALISLELIGASQNKLINEIEVGNNMDKLLTAIQRRYAKAPYFKDVFPLLQTILSSKEKNLARFLGYSLMKISSYLGMQTKFLYSSEIEKNNDLKFDARIMDICKRVGADHYINAIGGKELYSKDKFATEGIKLSFIDTKDIEYKQFDKEFVPNLSIIDVMMFNSKEETRELLQRYELV